MLENRGKIFGEMYFDDQLVMLDIDADTDLKAIEKLEGVLQEQGFVKESYLHAVLEREKVFATGLEMVDMGMAMPHTDPEHVNTPALALGILRHPVAFCGMGEPDKEVKVEILFMLAIKEPHAQLEMLQALLNVFQEPGKLTQLKQCKTQKEAADMLTGLLNR